MSLLRELTVLFLTVRGVCAAMGAPGTVSNDLPADVSTVLERVVAHHRVPGLAAVVLKGDFIVAEGAAGWRKWGATNRLSVHDQFLLCSGTKAMTATLAAMVVEEGRLSYSTTLGEIFSGCVPGMNPAWTNATLAQLLEHRAGVPAEGSRLWSLLRIQFSRTTTAEKRRAAAQKILCHAPENPPGTKYIYTALDYILVGVMLETVCGRSWEELIREKLWRPLGIASGGFGAPGDGKKVDEPWGHSGILLNGCPIAPDGFWSRLSMPLFFGPGGAVHMSITDWAKFISLHLSGNPANPGHHEMFLTPESFARLHRPGLEPGYQAGWYLGTRSWAKGRRPNDTGTVIASLGDNHFWHTEAWVAPEINFAILVVCNQGGGGGKPASRACSDAIGALMQDYLPRP